MTYKVVPFTAAITKKDTVSTVAAQIQNIIDDHSQVGWIYQGLEVVETAVAGTSGCTGSTPGFTTQYQMLVFVKND